jgi:UDP-N-acetyl-D-mannosaminuronic acid transferase (WecB/TagA/CpsF family)/8-oxo-dGTP pyrophosphatase MutT (NUDIX family)
MQHLLGVKTNTVGKKFLAKEIPNLKSRAKKTLYFLYSEFYLRANRNPFYQQALNNADYLTTDGRGAMWAQSKILEVSFGSRIYKNLFLKTPGIIRMPAFLVLLCLQLGLNIVSGVWYFLIKKNSSKSQDKLVLGRDYVYDILSFANQNSWKVQIIAGAKPDKKSKLEARLNELYPQIKLNTWTSNPDSSLMKDQAKWYEHTEQDKYCDDLTTDNLLDLFPELTKAKLAIQDFEPDILLVALGGGSGKQEFFVNYLKNDPQVSFRLATGIGAALDHLGTGAEQKKPPEGFQKLGLEWLYRFIFFPYRRKRIVDSILTFWFWFSLQNFVDQTYWRPTVVNIVKDIKGRYLLAQRHRNLIPGDIAWSFIQGGMDHISKSLFRESQKESLKVPSKAYWSEIITNGLRELKEETALDLEDVDYQRQVYVAPRELYSISLRRFLYLGCKYKGQTKYILPITVTNDKGLKHNWENSCVAWFKEGEVASFLAPNKLVEWEMYKQVSTV